MAVQRAGIYIKQTPPTNPRPTSGVSDEQIMQGSNPETGTTETDRSRGIGSAYAHGNPFERLSFKRALPG